MLHVSNLVKSAAVKWFFRVVTSGDLMGLLLNIASAFLLSVVGLFVKILGITLTRVFFFKTLL